MFKFNDFYRLCILHLENTTIKRFNEVNSEILITTIT